MVDDEVDITSTLGRGLEKRGFEVDAFNDPEQALMQFKPNYYDVVILDVRMAGMRGFQLAKEIWAKDEHARICFLSAFEIYQSEAQKVFRNFKTYSFIAKPIRVSELAEHLQSHLIPA